MKWVRQRRRNSIWYPLYVGSTITIQLNLFTKQKKTHRLREWTYGSLGGKKGRKDNLESLGLTCTHSIFKMDNQQGSTMLHRELCSTSCGSLDGSGVWARMDTCTCMAESLSCSSETTTTLLIGDPPIQNKKFKVQGEEKCPGTKEACKYLLKSCVRHSVIGGI